MAWRGTTGSFTAAMPASTPGGPTTSVQPTGTSSESTSFRIRADGRRIRSDLTRGPASAGVGGRFAMARKQGLIGLLAILLLSTGAVPAAAQGAGTATVFGTVKDEQGGVIPGATVTLISETQATKSSPV